MSLDMRFDLKDEELMNKLLHNAVQLRQDIDTLTHDKIIIKKNNKAYLVNKNQSLETLSPEAQDAAHTAYMQLKPRLTPFLVKEIDTTKPQKHSAHPHPPNATKDATAAMSMAAQNAINTLDALEASLQESMQRQPSPVNTLNQQPNLNLKPNLNPKPSLNPKPRLNQIQSPQTHGKNNLRPQPTPAARRNTLKHPTQPPLSDHEFRIKPGVVISPMLLQTLLRYNNNGSIVQQIKAQSTVIPHTTHHSPTTPTPFKTKPTPP